MRRVAPAWTLGILAGGFSRRLGQDKASLPFGGGTLLQHVARRLAPPDVPVLVATRPDGPGRDQGLPWTADLIPGTGPLSGMVALLGEASTPFVLAVACDTPLLPPDLGDRLLAQAGGMEAVVLEAHGVLQPLPVLLSRDLFPPLLRLLEAGERRARVYVDHAPCAIVPLERVYPQADPDEILLNLNEEKDLKRALELLNRRPPR